MCPAPQEYVNIHLTRRYQQTVAIARWYDGVPVREAYTQAAVCHDFGQGQVGRFHVKVALDNLQVGRNAAQELVRLAVGYVAQTENLADLAGREELLELRGGVSACASCSCTMSSLVWCYGEEMRTLAGMSYVACKSVRSGNPHGACETYRSSVWYEEVA